MTTRRPQKFLGIAGSVLAVICGWWVYTSGFTIEQIVVTAIHTDSLQYLCYAFQLSPLDYVSATRILTEVLAFANQDYSGYCFAPNGAPAPIWESYYTRLTLSSLLALAATSGIPALVFLVPLLVFGTLGFLWGFAVGGLPLRYTAFKFVILLLPLVSLASVLWLSSMMTEGVFTLIVVGALFATHLYRRRVLQAVGYAWMMLGASLILTITRPSWVISGCFVMLAVVALMNSRARWFRRATAFQRALVGALILALTSFVFLAIERLLPRVVTPEAIFPTALEPQDTLPIRPEEILLVVRVFVDVQVVGVQQALRIGDIGSVLLLAIALLSVAILIARRSWSYLLIVGSTWIVSAVTSGVLALCCGGLSSYFRFSITSLFSSIFAAVLSFQEPTHKGSDRSRREAQASR